MPGDGHLVEVIRAACAHGHTAGGAKASWVYRLIWPSLTRGLPQHMLLEPAIELLHSPNMSSSFTAF